jgi:hypothetical protein
MSQLGLGEREVLQMIDEGQLLWAFDLALDSCGSARKRKLMLLPQCVDDWQIYGKSSLTWAEVLTLVLPQGQETLRAKELIRCLNVCESHLYNFLRRKEITACSKWWRGPKGSASISTPSVIEFLKKRCYPFPIT